MQELGQKITHRQLNDQEFVQELQRKLLEEAKELDPKDPKAVDELADLLEVIETIGRELGHDFDSLRQIQKDRLKKRGGFEDRIFVERLDLEDSDPWADYYAKESDRFTELS